MHNLLVLFWMHLVAPQNPLVLTFFVVDTKPAPVMESAVTGRKRETSQFSK